jgi:hypothetical protein
MGPVWGAGCTPKAAALTAKAASVVAITERERMLVLRAQFGRGVKRLLSIYVFLLLGSALPCLDSKIKQERSANQ